MIRFLLRALGLLCLAAAFVFLVYDGTRSIAADTVIYTSVTELWTAVHASSLQQLKPFIEQHVGSWFWDRITTPFLEAPVAVVFAIIGAILVLLGRPKKPLIGYTR
jgi:hypothetical protein